MAGLEGGSSPTLMPEDERLASDVIMAYRRRRELDEIILAYCWVGLLLAAHVFKTKTWQTYPVVILTLIAFTIYRIVHPGPSNPTSGSGNGHRSHWKRAG